MTDSNLERGYICVVINNWLSISGSSSKFIVHANLDAEAYMSTLLVWSAEEAHRINLQHGRAFAFYHHLHFAHHPFDEPQSTRCARACVWCAQCPHESLRGKRDRGPGHSIPHHISNFRCRCAQTTLPRRILRYQRCKTYERVLTTKTKWPTERLLDLLASRHKT